MKILLVYPPFCTPASPPYSITNLHAFLKSNLTKRFELDVLDLNIAFHNKKFSEYKQYYQDMKKDYDLEEYNRRTEEYRRETKKIYSKNNRAVVDGGKPELFNELLDEIISKKPDVVAFSIVYSSQAFYAFALIEELKSKGIKTVVGGPAINEKLISAAYTALGNEVELLEFLTQEDSDHDNLNFEGVPDFTIYKLKDYFVPQPVIPLKTSSNCYYKQCTFCTHHDNAPYFEFSLSKIKNIINISKEKNFFIVDDMIHKKRLLEIADMVKPLGVSWVCQLRPTDDLDYETLKTLRESGLKLIMWGVESGCDRILKLINKGTNNKDIRTVLQNSHRAGIKNIAYIIFGFPTETKEEFIETIDFLKENDESIDLVSTSIFGLQKGTPIYENPKKFGITKITTEERTILEPKISYEVSEGLTHAEAATLRENYKKSIENINKFPKTMNFFREHMLCLV